MEILSGLDPKIQRDLLAYRLEQLIPYGLAKIELGIIDPTSIFEAHRISDEAQREQYLQNKIASLVNTGIISPLAQRETLARQWCHLDPEQMRKQTHEYELGLRRKRGERC